MVLKITTVTCVIRHFFSSSNLNRHKVIHSDVKELECALCNKTFTQKSNLSMHIMNVHGSVYTLYEGK